jgi:phosphatidylglycerol lysyltransferase
LSKGTVSSAAPERLRELIREHGRNCNSFLALYPGFRFFTGESGVIAFFETGAAWVAAGEPFAPEAAQPRLLAEFARAAAAAGKSALAVPVNEKLAAAAEREGYGRLMIGSEPVLDLERYPPTGKTWLSVVATAKQLHGKGARVRELDPAAISANERAALDAITDAWFATRKVERLSFLNQVDPWLLSRDKKYFVVEKEGRASAFLAAIPIWARNGWYFIDAMRGAETEAGTIELLFLEAARRLREQGAREISLGVAPLSNLERAPDAQRSRPLHHVLSYVYERGDQFYNFRSLHQFKVKFDPSREEPVYLLFCPEKLSLRAAKGLLEAFTGRSLAMAAVSGARRALARFSLREWVRASLAPGVVIRSAPPGLPRLLWRCRGTVLLTAGIIVAYAVQALDGTLSTEFSCPPMHWLGAIPHAIFASFAHRNFAHLAFNVVGLALFGGLLEYIAGSTAFILCTVAGAALANPLTCATLTVLGTGPETDVGVSLAMFAAAGGAARFLRREMVVLSVLAIGSAVAAFGTRSPLSLNHLAALGVGAAAIRLLLRN